MMELEQETTLAKVRLHWIIFIPVLLVALGPILASLPIIFMLHGLVNALGQMGMPANPRLNLIWLLILVPYFLIVLGLLLATWFTYWKSEFMLTNRRLAFRTGFLSRRSGELPLENVESIYISEPLLGRMCGYGSVTVTTVGGADFPLLFIGSPQSFHSTLQKAVLNAKKSARPIPKLPGSGSPSDDDDSRYKPK
ncbi:MAG: PH domain-containing protein [Verrucomicrobiota bacterium]|jgi:uncharacterized membrane protein YdbT with pleckstrin-like domain